MFFPDMLKTDAERQRFDEMCAAFSDFFQDCNRCLVTSWNIVQEAAAPTGEVYHSVILMLIRHVIESLDGVAVLVSKSASHSCQPLLRSALEAFLGVVYILEKDTKQRALAYQLAHAHKKINLYNRLDPTTTAGKELRRVLDGDPLEGFFNALPFLNYPKLIANLQRMFAHPDFQPIEAEWKRLKALDKRHRDPAWYSLFGGPRSVRELATHLHMAGMYEFLYRMWSESVHAGMAMEAVGQKGGNTVVRPVRHPEQLQSAVQHAAFFALELAERIVKAYAPAKWPQLHAQYKEKIGKRVGELASGQIIRAPWKDTVL
jgi:hypothetical protein